MSLFNQYKKTYQEGKTLPQNFYTDENIFSEEMKSIYFQQWLMVDHVSRIKDPGNYFGRNEWDNLCRWRLLWSKAG